jgi:hypothetical protein
LKNARPRGYTRPKSLIKVQDVVVDASSAGRTNPTC